jgi:hypothetical protein
MNLNLTDILVVVAGAGLALLGLRLGVSDGNAAFFLLAVIAGGTAILTVKDRLSEARV